MQTKKPTQNYPSRITMYYQNVSGGRSKGRRLNNFLHKTNHKIIALTETWFNHFSIQNTEIIGSTQFKIYCFDRSELKSTRKDGGGVALLVHKSWLSEKINFGQPTVIEHIELRMKLNDENHIILSCVYRVPTRDKQSTTNEFSEIIANLQRKYKNDDIIVLGDFNIPKLYYNYNADKIFLNLCARKCLVQVSPILNRRKVELDLIFTNNLANIATLEHESIDFFDGSTDFHLPITIQYQYLSAKYI